MEKQIASFRVIYRWDFSSLYKTHLQPAIFALRALTSFEVYSQVLQYTPAQVCFAGLSVNLQRRTSCEARICAFRACASSNTIQHFRFVDSVSSLLECLAGTACLVSDTRCLYGHLAAAAIFLDRTWEGGSGAHPNDLINKLF